MRVTVIGAGPSGCYVGYLLAKKGHQVDIYDKKKTIGKPIQCTGILTKDFKKFKLPIEKFLINNIQDIEVNSSKRTFHVKQEEYIICREKFDTFLLNLAKKEGAKVYLEHSFIDKNKVKFRGKVKNISADVIIAADGPLSPTAKAYGFFHNNRRNYYGVQAVVKGKFDKQKIKTYFGKKYGDGFAWVTPESNSIARVGLVASGRTKSIFDKFMENQNFQILEMQGGTIPIFNPQQKLKKGNCYLLGDASSYVKATTLGGIIPSMAQAKILAKCLNEGKNYEKEIRPLRRKMLIHLYLHRMFKRFSDNDWDKLLQYVNQGKIKRLLKKHTRDNPIPLVMKSLWYEPRFLRFLR